ncbi:unnamed protein product [Rotaria magnacalcarata]|uniref:EF-hand domain-containing protein n=1 Tax=Rotaria magnacalcarata TaxID=392030 RepID=A0A819WPS1_9BILA|nr:unnamed protein product [Rotaria magnacalcarata]CAF1527990.1 unnamed protein product [Rotaria magnacalcarata]CAF2048223.1 unnamed protein product [Rotaria magnacalcarata]CAF2093265.1 unnamed protein product [Rotaria magnacalcarata]CAF2125660.1 unnamed protein product [Rotaria magnacalcarata]
MGNKHPKIPKEKPLTRKDIDDLKVSTKFSEAEIQQWHKGFFQDCPNGKLDRGALKHIYKSYYGRHGAELFCKYMFALFDMKDDGEIDFKQFLIAVSSRSQGSLDNRLGFLFDMYETSGDRQIDSKELENLITAIYDLVDCTDRKGKNHPKERAKDIISQLDRNKDNKLNREEFIAGCENDSIIWQLLAPHFKNRENDSIK